MCNALRHCMLGNSRVTGCDIVLYINAGIGFSEPVMMLNVTLRIMQAVCLFTVALNILGQLLQHCVRFTAVHVLT